MADGVTNRGDEDQLSRFLKKFPKTVYHVPTELDPDKRGVFFTLIDGDPETPSNLRSSTDDHDSLARWYLHERIKSAFIKLNQRCPHKGLYVQFWEPRYIPSGMALLTSDEPFILDHLDPRHQEYRLWCVNDDNVSDPDDQPALFPIQTFFPDVHLDLELNADIPLVDKALECGFTSQILLPVYCQTECKTRSGLAGVIECCLGRSCLLEVFTELRSVVVSVGLCAHCVMCQRPETNPGLEAAKKEIKEALQKVCESNHLALAQVWIPHDVENIPSKPFFPKEEEEKNPELKIGKFMAKLCGYRFDNFDDGFSSLVKDYCDTCDALPYQVGLGFVGKTLMTYEPRFCKNIGELTNKEGFEFLRHVSNRTQCSCLAICLRSTHTGKDVDYAFEFLWPKSRNYFLVLQSLLLTLKSCLPSFKFPSGAQLDGELRVEDVENSTGSSVGFIKIFEQPKALDKVAHDAGISGGKGVKRKFDELPENESEGQTVALADRYVEDDDYISILATYKEHVNYEIVIQTLYTLANVNKEIEKEFKLDPGSYTMKYEFEGKTGTLTTDQDFSSCIKLCRSGQKHQILLHVETK